MFPLVLVICDSCELTGGGEKCATWETKFVFMQVYPLSTN